MKKPKLKRLGEIKNEDGTFIATVCDAAPKDVLKVLNATQARNRIGDNTRSAWTWFRLANGDLVLGCYPHADLYEELSQSGRAP